MQYDLPILPRLNAEPLSAAYLPGLRQLFQDRRVTPTLTATGEPLSNSDVGAMVARANAHWDEHGWGPWAFLDKATGAFVGRGGLRRMELSGKPETELGYALLPDWWGRGLASEMARESVRWGFDVLGLPDSIAFTLATNQASQKVLQKTGFVYERSGLYANLPHVFYRLTPEGFRAVCAE